MPANDPKDTEMWFEDGDVLVYLITKGGKTKPAPSMRLHSQMIEDSGSKEFIKQLRNGHVPAEFPHFLANNAASPSHATTPDEPNMPFELSKHSQGVGNEIGSQTPHVRPLKLTKKPSLRGQRVVQYELYIPWPGPDSGTDQLLWHLTTRNFFAILLNRASLWGQTFYSSLFLVYERIIKFPDYLPRDIDRGQWITDYLSRKQFDDVRNNPSYAAGLLAFSEIPGVRWREGYTEGFVHCSGMLRLGLQNIPEFRNVSAISSIYIETANKEMLKRVHRAQIWLADFNFSDMWPITSAPPPAAKSSFDRFSKWLRRFYEQEFGRWPPTHENTWLTRGIIQRLNADFHTVYDFFVDRDVIFEDSNGSGPSRRVTMTSKAGKFFRADTSDLPITDILVGFDNRQNFPHIPHPYPITPPSVPMYTTSSSSKSSFFGPKSKKPMTAAEHHDLARARGLSFPEASNLYILRDQYTGVPEGIVEKMLHFEEVDALRPVDPYDARRGRWILIYGVLQVLASVGVDTPGLRFKEGIEYHLNPPMKGIVPWASEGWPAEPEAKHEFSYCWTVPSTWKQSSSGRTSGTNPRVNPIGVMQRVRSPSREVPKEDRSPGDRLRRGEGKENGSTMNRTNGHRSNSSAIIAGTSGGNRQAVPWKPLAIGSPSNGRTRNKDDEKVEGPTGLSSISDSIDTRQRAEEWVSSDASGGGLSGVAVTDTNERSFRDEGSLATSYSLRGAYENSNGGRETVILGVGMADENPTNGRVSLAARRRRTQIHELRTLETPQGW